MAKRTNSLPTSDGRSRARNSLANRRRLVTSSDSANGAEVAAQVLRFAPDILRRLGEELIPRPEQGILELARNSYDADASECIIELPSNGAAGGTVMVRDDGNGMSATDLINGWLVLGRSRKSSEQRTKRGRLAVGNKGLGRLAALRLGTEVVVTTRPEAEPGVEYRLAIDWAAYDRVELIDEVPQTITRSRTSAPPGTDIELRNLRDGFSSRDVRRLSRALLLLSDPFESDAQFRASLIAPGFHEYEQLVRTSYFPDASYHLIARVDNRGRASAEVYDWKGRTLFSAPKGALGGADRRYDAPATVFEFWTFRLSGAEFTDRQVTVSEVREWLRAVGGVHLYHRGLRVFPYGDEGHDWLDLNLSRTRNPEERPSTNNSIGRVLVDDPTGILIQKTDRSGFIETHAFDELRQFAKDALSWMATERLALAEKRRAAVRAKSSGGVARAQAKVRTAIDKLPPRTRKAVEGAVASLEKAQQRETRALKEEVELYRTLSTVGTTAAVFAHESAHPATRISKMAGQLRRVAEEKLSPDVRRLVERPADMILRDVERLRVYASVPFTLLSREKRRPGYVDVNDAVRQTEQMFRPFYDHYQVNVDLDLATRSLGVQGTVAAAEAIMANLLSNALRSFTREGARLTGREVRIETHLDGTSVVVRVFDNGPGIEELSLSEIWLPGKTTQPNGTGLGLTIVRDAVVDLGGSVRAIAHGELGGAEFQITLPFLRASR